MVHHRRELEPDLADDLGPQLQRRTGVLPVVAKRRPQVGVAGGGMIIGGSHDRPHCCVLTAMAMPQTTLQLECGGTVSARRRCRPFFLRLEPRQRRANGCKWAVFVLLL